MISEMWMEYCQSLFQDRLAVYLNATEPRIEQMEPSIIKEEIRRARKYFKVRKTTRIFAIPIETMDVLGKYHFYIFHIQSNKIWHTVYVPLHKNVNKNVSQLSTYCT